MAKNQLKSEYRCQFVSSHGRRCGLHRAKEHPSFCAHHARAEVNFADQFSRSPEASDLVAQIVGAEHDFRSVTSVNHFIGQVITLRGRKLLGTRDTALFGYLSQLLLISNPGVKAEFIRTSGYDAWEELLRLSLSNSYPNSLDATDDASPSSEASPAPARPRKNSASTKRTPAKKRRFRVARTRSEFAEQVFAKLGIELPAFDPRGTDPVEDEPSEEAAAEDTQQTEETQDAEQSDYADRSL